MTDAEKPDEGELILYQTQEGAVRIEVLYQSETFWLNQKRIAELTRTVWQPEAHGPLRCWLRGGVVGQVGDNQAAPELQQRTAVVVHAAA